jgi:beta-phosphoglucomutase-like phosphatase (HAD superfamily)
MLRALIFDVDGTLADTSATAIASRSIAHSPMPG